MEAGFLQHGRFQALLDVLHGCGYRCIGPQVRDGAIVYDALSTCRELPQGVRDLQSAGSYRLERTSGLRYFGWANGPQALKPMVFAPEETLWRVQRADDGALRFSASRPSFANLAVIGVRACDLAALALLDRHFLGTAVADPCYAARRSGMFLVAVHCSDPSGSCFCASTGDGPQASGGFDLALSELDEGFIVETGSARGADTVAGLGLEPVTASQRDAAARQIDTARARQRRGLPSRDLRAVLVSNPEHPRWEEVAQRCLACGNCTSVCPTCFCHASCDSMALDGSEGAHARIWDSCFTAGHSQIHGLTVRPDTRTRYRQWLTHKLGSWHEQFGRSGCVGCGRCISWCPAGIDITEEAAAICSGSSDG